MNQSNLPEQRSPRLLDQAREILRVQRFARSTERAYLAWIERYLRYYRGQAGRWIHPRDMGKPEAEEFLTHLACEEKVSASTQNQALSALLFLYQRVLEIELPSLDSVRARRSTRLPVVLS